MTPITLYLIEFRSDECPVAVPAMMHSRSMASHSSSICRICLGESAATFAMGLA